MLSIGYLERWWGPGAEGTLLLSTNARPVPSISLERQESTPMDVPLLRWLGPWRFLTFMGQLEDDRDYPDALLFGMRIELRPLPSLQIAASRTAQWCGDGRPCDGGTFWDLLIGNDNDQDLERAAGQPAGRVRRALDLARGQGAARTVCPGHRRGRGRLPAVEVPRPVRRGGVGRGRRRQLAGARRVCRHGL